MFSLTQIIQVELDASPDCVTAKKKNDTLPVTYLFRLLYFKLGHKLPSFIKVAVAIKRERNDASRSPEHRGTERQLMTS